jgi:predicted transcriptional regulator YdeE
MDNQLPAEQLPEDIQRQIDLDASHEQYASAYCRGAMAWAHWKQRYDELKAQSALWVKFSERVPLHKAFWNIEDGFKKDCSFPIRINGDYYGMGDLYDNRQEGAPDPIYYIVVRGDGAEYFSDAFHRFEWLDDESGATDWKAKFDEEKALTESLVEDFQQQKRIVQLVLQSRSRMHKQYAQLKEKADKMEVALKIVQQWQLPPTGQFFDDDKTKPMSYGYCYGSNGERDYMKAIATKALAWKGEVDNEMVKPGLKFRSKAAPINSYEVVEVYPDTGEFKVKETRECQVSGTICFEVWTIEGFKKYFDLGVYYIEK